MNKLMCHVVAGYPSQNDCVELMLGMDKAGVPIIEVQIPFSDPIADGETIMRANDAALINKTDTRTSLALRKTARHRRLKADIFIMSDVQKPVHVGLVDFRAQAKAAGAQGLIIPDMPYDSAEHEEIMV